MALYDCYYHRIATTMYVLHVSHEPTKRDHRFRGRCWFGCLWDHPEFPVQNGFNPKTSIPPPPPLPQIRIKTESWLKNPYPKETVGKNGLFGEGHVSRERGSRFDSPKTCRRSPLVSTKYVQTSLTCKRYRFFAISQNTLYSIFFCFPNECKTDKKRI